MVKGGAFIKGGAGGGGNMNGGGTRGIVDGCSCVEEGTEPGVVVEGCVVVVGVVEVLACDCGGAGGG